MGQKQFKQALMAAFAFLWAISLSITRPAFGDRPAPRAVAESGLLRGPRHLVGIDYGVILKVPGALSAKAVAHLVQLSPPVAFAVAELAPGRYDVLPRHFWPPATHLTLRMHQGPQQIAVHWHTDDGKMLKVDLTTQTMEAYEGDTLIRIMPVSTGVVPDWTTPTGKFSIYKRVKDDHMVGGQPGTADSWNVEHVPYAQYIYQGIAMHGAWWNHHFGVPKSHGCIQLSTRTGNKHPAETVDNAQWVWNFSDLGTPVTVEGRTPRDLSKPLAYPRTAPATGA